MTMMQKRKLRLKNPLYRLYRLVKSIPDEPIWGNFLFPIYLNRKIVYRQAKSICLRRFNQN